MLPTQMHILIVREDEGEDCRFRDAIVQQMAEAKVDIEALGEAQATLNKLRKLDPRPDLLLFEVGFRSPDGWRFLAELRADRLLGTLPVFVISDSEDRADIDRADQHNVVGFIPRPTSPQAYADTAKTLLAYWSIMQHPNAAA